MAEILDQGKQLNMSTSSLRKSPGFYRRSNPALIHVLAPLWVAGIWPSQKTHPAGERVGNGRTGGTEN